MPLYSRFIHQDAEVAVWKIEEPEPFFREATQLISLIRTDKRRIEYYAGRYLLQHMIPNLDLNEIRISDIGKPYLQDGSFKFSISHSYPYIAVAVHTSLEAGLDIQVYREKIVRLQAKFLNEKEFLLTDNSIETATLLWNAKEAMFKWRGTGGQDFSEQLLIHSVDTVGHSYELECSVLDRDGSIHPLILLGKTDHEYALAVAVG